MFCLWATVELGRVKDRSFVLLWLLEERMRFGVNALGMGQLVSVSMRELVKR